MSNLFKKGFASLALASAMASSVFAGDAAYIDVKVKYLSGNGKATLGYESWNATTEKYKAGAREDLVELYIRVLDKDGMLADKDSVNDALIPMIITRSGHTKNVNNLRANVAIGNMTGESNESTHSIARHVSVEHATKSTNTIIVNKNAARYTLDYTNHSSATLIDSLTIKAGNLNKKINVQLDTVDATSLLVRVTTKDTIDATYGGKGRYLNDDFKDIRLVGEETINNSGNTSKLAFGNDGTLGAQAHSFPQVTAGHDVPLRIFASTGANNESSLGQFTMAPNLEGKQIVVVAVGDYNLNGNATIYLGQTELTMKDGIAAGNMVVNYGLPERNITSTPEAAGHDKFDVSREYGGLGVAFIAYAKDDSVINNHEPVSLSNGALKIASLMIDGNNSNTDAIKIKSGEAVALKGGKFDNDPSSQLASKLWTGDKTDVFVSNSKGILPDMNKSISVAVVDYLGNPAILATSVLAGTTSGLKATFKVNGIAQADSSTENDFNVTNESGLITAGINGVTSGKIVVIDGNKTIALSSIIEAKYTGESLAGIAPFKFNAHTVDLVGNTPNDIIGDLKSFVTDINVTNNGGSKTIYGEKLAKDDYVDMKVIVRVSKTTDGKENNEDGNDVSDGNITARLSFKVINNKGQIDTGIFFGLEGQDGNASTKTDGGTNIDLNGSSGSTVVHISSASVEASGVIGQIAFKDVNDSTGRNFYESILGTTTTFILKANGKGDDNITHKRNIDAYVATTTTSPNAKDFVDSVSKPGKAGKTVIDFDFSGTLVEQHVGKAVAKITFVSGNSDDNDSLKAGVVGKPFVSTDTVKATANTRVVTATIPDNGRLSVALYGAYGLADKAKTNSDINDTVYNIQSITINGFTQKTDGNATIVYTSRHGNKLTDAVDIDVGEDRNVTVVVGERDSAAKVKISSLGAGSVGAGTGDSTKTIASLPGGLVSDSSYGTSPIKTNRLKEVSTNTYYSLFETKRDLEITDAYGNLVNMKNTLLEKNYVLNVSDAECAEASMNKGADKTKRAYVYFKPCAAGKEIDLIVTVAGTEAAPVTNTITFRNIVKKEENTKFIVSLNVGDPDYNIINNDVVVRVTPDGGTERSDTVITVTTDAKDAHIKVVPVDLITGREFGDMTGNGNTVKATIKRKGSYFVITSDKPGKITVKADAVIPSSESVAGDDVALTGTVSFTMINVDTAAPTITATSTSGSITVTVKDDGLDTKATTIRINDMSGKKIADAKYTSNGVYVADGLSQGTYSINVYAMDLSGNVHKQTIVQNVGVGSGSVSIEEATAAMLIAKKEYKVSGTFTSHKFGDDKAKNWIYTRASDSKSFQLLGNASSDKDAFGWKETKVEAGTDDIWYMIQTGNSKFDWVLVDTDGVTYKLKGAKSNGSFDFSGRLNVNASHKDGMLTFTAK